MKSEFEYSLWSKVTTWKRDAFIVEASSKEEADAIIKKNFMKDELYNGFESADVNWVETDWQGDDEELDWDGGITKEVIDSFGEPIIDNTPVEIKRDEKLNLLGL